MSGGVRVCMSITEQNCESSNIHPHLRPPPREHTRTSSRCRSRMALAWRAAWSLAESILLCLIMSASFSSCESISMLVLICGSVTASRYPPVVITCSRTAVGCRVYRVSHILVCIFVGVPFSEDTPVKCTHTNKYKSSPPRRRRRPARRLRPTRGPPTRHPPPPESLSWLGVYCFCYVRVND